jgi:hypothetical protein
MAILLYFLKVNIGLSAFYALYWLVFSRNTFFRLNRFYLLGALIISFLLPFIGIKHNDDSLPASLNDLTGFGLRDILEQSIGFLEITWLECIQFVVLTGSAILLARFVYSIVQIFKLLFKSEPLEYTDTFEGNYYWLIKSKFTTSSFSFFNFLILNKEDSFHNRKFVIEHEQVHIDQRHTVDIIMVEVFQILCWYNPVLIMYKKSLQKLHEFIADSIIHHTDLVEYAQFLFAYNFRSQISHLTTSFMKTSMLKQRIQMLTRPRSNEYLLTNYLLIIPLMLLLGYFVNAKKSPLAPDGGTLLSSKNIVHLSNLK